MMGNEMSQLNPQQIQQEISFSLSNLWSYINSDRLLDVILALFLVLIGFMVAKVVSNTFIRTLGNKFNPHQRLVWQRGLFYSIFLFFLMAGLKEAGFNLSLFLGAAGILTVALGFASQTSASNLISGLFLIGEGAFEVGDTIQITFIRGQVLEGEVLSIDLLSVKLLTLDNVYIRLPNEQLIRTPVLNVSKFPIRRVPISLSVNFNQNISQVRSVLFQLAQQYHLVLDEPKPTITVTAFRESSLELLFAVWCKRENFNQVRDEIQELICQSFIEHHIEIAIPKMNVVQPILMVDDEDKI